MLFFRYKYLNLQFIKFNKMKEDFAMLDENDDASLHTIIKPKTMDNNCVNMTP